jgi:xylan 1,4-beta-xylosidase
VINVFSVLDFYLSVGIKPTLELSFMPEALAANPSDTMMHYKGITSTPKDPNQWATFIYDFATALLDRYGADEVRSWRFEVWNELWLHPYAPFPPDVWATCECPLFFRLS